MGLISNLLGYREVTLASSASMGNPFSTNLGVKSTDRIKREGLEEDYRFDPVIFNTINKDVQVILHAGFEIKTKVNVYQKFYDNFFENIGQIGEETTTEELVEYILQDMLMYGNSFVELVYDAKTDSKIVDLHLIPEKKMDYAKNSAGEIIVDSYGKPIGYILSVPFGYSAKGLGDAIPLQFKGKVNKTDNQIFFLPKRIAHFKLFTYGDRFYGIGLIEPAHTSTVRKRLIEDARTNEIYTRGANTIIANVGNESHEAGQEDLVNVLNQLANFKHDRYFAFPDWVKVGTLPIDQNQTIDDTLKYLTVNQATSAGMPLAFATGLGEATNRSTLNNQQQMLELSCEHYVMKFSSQFNKLILRRIALTNDIKEAAKIYFGDIRAEEKTEKFKRLQGYSQMGAVSPEEVRDYVKSSEDVPLDDKKYETWKNEPSEEDDSEEQDSEELSQAVKLSQKKMVELGGYYMPEMKKEVNITEFSDKYLAEYHDNLHVLWNRLSEGYQIGWSFAELSGLHQNILGEFEKRKIKHIAPINDLDKIDMRY